MFYTCNKSEDFKEHKYGLTICATGTPINCPSNPYFVNDSLRRSKALAIEDTYYESLKRRENRLSRKYEYTKSLCKHSGEELAEYSNKLCKNTDDEQVEYSDVLHKNVGDELVKAKYCFQKNKLGDLKIEDKPVTESKIFSENVNYQTKLIDSKLQLTYNNTPLETKENSFKKNICNLKKNLCDLKKCDEKPLKVFVLTGFRINNIPKHGLWNEYSKSFNLPSKDGCLTNCSLSFKHDHSINSKLLVEDNFFKCCSLNSGTFMNNSFNSRKNSINYCITNNDRDEKIVITRYTQYEPQHTNPEFELAQKYHDDNQENRKKKQEISGGIVENEGLEFQDNAYKKHLNQFCNQSTPSNVTEHLLQQFSNEKTSSLFQEYVAKSTADSICSGKHMLGINQVNNDKTVNFQKACFNKVYNTVQNEFNEKVCKQEIFFLKNNIHKPIYNSKIEFPLQNTDSMIQEFPLQKTVRANTINARNKFCFVLHEFKEKYSEMHKVSEDFI
ncbi:uncharacterized protein LOC136085840 [Hydra vulgaris]|uniref:Uncharacterized protein LOC136085840 n=1 Tax=Hydra vulgaris TaxID=6087 RepID=A0ABM4CNZ2_HYDVU